ILVSGLFALIIGFVSLRRSGIYFSILTLAFAQMSYNLAYSVLTPITNGETGLLLTLNDARYLDHMTGQTFTGQPVPTLLVQSLGGYAGCYSVAGFLMLACFIPQGTTRSRIGKVLRGNKWNQSPIYYPDFNATLSTLPAFGRSGTYAGIAAAL